MSEFKDSFASNGKIVKRNPQAHHTDPRGVLEEYSNGLTKREYFAALAMQGLISCELPAPGVLATVAVQYADTLIAELERSER